MGETRKIAAILVADVVGYSRLAGTDEDRTLSRLRGLRSNLIDPAIDAHHGRILKLTRASKTQINRFLEDHSRQFQPLTRTADLDKIIAVRRGHQALDSIQ